MLTVWPTVSPGTYAILGTKTVTTVECCSPLSMPVIVTLDVPGVEPVQVSVDVPNVWVPVRVMMFWLRLHRGGGVDVEFVRVTVPVNPLLAVTVTMDALWVPTGTGRRDGLAETLKLFSGPVTVTGRMREPEEVLVFPDTPTWYGPVPTLLGTGTVRVTLALPPAVSVTLDALSESCGKLKAKALSETFPANPF